MEADDDHGGTEVPEDDGEVKWMEEVTKLVDDFEIAVAKEDDVKELVETTGWKEERW